jgi:3-(3-hydroxy-phenyl)propionate hydroxylase
MTPQFIGQGMNAGIRDADNLSWKLADVIHHRLDPSNLETYESERRPHAKATIDLSVFNKDLVSTGNRSLCRLRDVGLPLASRMPLAGDFIKEAKMKPRPRFRSGYLGMPRGRRLTRSRRAGRRPSC